MTERARFDKAGQVILPWAPVSATPRAAVRAESREVAPARPTLADRQQEAGPSAAHLAAVPPALRALGLPTRPLPTLPEDDRRVVSDDDLLGAAVALDVLSTRTRKLAAAPTLLASLTDALLEIGRLSAAADGIEADLEAHARGNAGAARARLVSALTRLSGGEKLAQGGSRPALCTPRSARAALDRIERLAEVAVRHASLLMEARAPVDYWQG